MKNNKEFLEGVYRKAEILEKEKDVEETSKRKIPYERYIKYASVAAMFIIIPLIVFNSGIMNPYEEIADNQLRIATIDDPLSNFLESDFIVLGETREIKDSVYVKEESYIYTDITIYVDNTFLGEINEDEIVLRVNGGKVKKEKLFSEMGGDFHKGERSLLFINKDEAGLYYLVKSGYSQFKESERDVFIDKLGNKYNFEDIKKYINIE